MTVVLTEQDAELGQLRQVIDRLQEEKEKASGRAKKRRSWTRIWKVTRSWSELLLK